MAAGLVSDIARTAVLLIIRNVFPIATQATMGVLLAPLAVHHWAFHRRQREEVYPRRGRLTAAKQQRLSCRAPFQRPNVLCHASGMEARLRQNKGGTIRIKVMKRRQKVVNGTKEFG